MRRANLDPILVSNFDRTSTRLADDVGASLAEVCAELKLPIGVMAFG